MTGASKQRFTVVPAVYILFYDGDKVLLLKRSNTGYYDGSYSLPAGHIDGGESALTAAIRESDEEIGAKLSRDELKLVHVLHRQSDMPALHERIDLFFTTAVPHPEITNREPQKCSELRWCELDQLPAEITPEVGHVLAAIKQGKLYSDLNF